LWLPLDLLLLLLIVAALIRWTEAVDTMVVITQAGCATAHEERQKKNG
jgi:hypothetical protein